MIPPGMPPMNDEELREYRETMAKWAPRVVLFNTALLLIGLCLWYLFEG